MTAEFAVLRSGFLAVSLVIGHVAMAGEAAFETHPRVGSPQEVLEAEMVREFDASAQDMGARIRALVDGDERAASLAEHSLSTHRVRYLELRARRMRAANAVTAVRSPFVPDVSSQPVEPTRLLAPEAGASWDLYSSAGKGASAAAPSTRPWGLYDASKPSKAAPAPAGAAHALRASGEATYPYLVYRAAGPEDRQTP